VFNHLGKESFAWRDVARRGTNSIYADWFAVTDWGPPLAYRSWDGGGWMPLLRKDRRHGIAAASARQHLFDVTRRWMDPNGDGDPADGVDGWRLDVAPDVPAAFWRDWRRHVKAINSNALICAEIWGPAPAQLQGDQWDTVMNYPFAARAVRWFIDRTNKVTATEFDRLTRDALSWYPAAVNPALWNLYDSHDTDRLVNMIANPDRRYDQGNRPQEGDPYHDRQPGPDAYRVLKLMVVWQMTAPGAPLIYYGDEVGLFGADDPANRQPMVWRPGQIRADVLAHYRRLIAIRNTYPALRTGTLAAWFIDDARDLYGYTRGAGSNLVAVVLNNGPAEATIDVESPFPDGTALVDVLRADAGRLAAVPMAEAGFAGYPAQATVRVLQVGPRARPARPPAAGKLPLCVPARDAVVLVRRPARPSASDRPTGTP